MSAAASTRLGRESERSKGWPGQERSLDNLCFCLLTRHNSIDGVTSEVMLGLLQNEFSTCRGLTCECSRFCHGRARPAHPRLASLPAQGRRVALAQGRSSRASCNVADRITLNARTLQWPVLRRITIDAARQRSRVSSATRRRCRSAAVRGCKDATDFSRELWRRSPRWGFPAAGPKISGGSGLG